MPVKIKFPAMVPAKNPTPREDWPENKASACEECGDSFGLLLDRHHCRFCVREVCTSCSKGTIGAERERACRPCVTTAIADAVLVKKVYTIAMCTRAKAIVDAADANNRSNPTVAQYLFKNFELDMTDEDNKDRKPRSEWRTEFINWIRISKSFSTISVNKAPVSFALGTHREVDAFITRLEDSKSDVLDEAEVVTAYSATVYQARSAAVSTDTSAEQFVEQVYSNRPLTSN
jgi:ribosomal protein S14